MVFTLNIFQPGIWRDCSVVPCFQNVHLYRKFMCAWSCEIWCIGRRAYVCCGESTCMRFQIHNSANSSTPVLVNTLYPDQKSLKLLVTTPWTLMLSATVTGCKCSFVHTVGNLAGEIRRIELASKTKGAAHVLAMNGSVRAYWVQNRKSVRSYCIFNTWNRPDRIHKPECIFWKLT